VIVLAGEVAIVAFSYRHEVAQDARADMGLERVSHDEMDRQPQAVREKILQLKEAKEARGLVENDQDVEVAP
jgi:hypothetical protein